jgi:septum formation protein
MIILGSQSKTRLSLLRNAGVAVEAMPSPCDEEAIKAKTPSANATELAQHLAREKSLALSAIKPNDLILGADQTLSLHDHILHKTSSGRAAKEQLLMLRGQQHHLHSAVCVTRNRTVIFETLAMASLKMRHFSAEFLETYVDTVGDDVAMSLGGYQIEGLGIQLFENIEGDHSVILGLPLLPLLAFLREVGELTS